MHLHTEHPTATPRQDKQGWSRWHITWSVAIVAVLGLALISSPPVEAKTFHCGAGDVACLVAAVKQANVQPGQSHEIRLAVGVYTLTTIDNVTDGANGLPSITCQLTIEGEGPDLTFLTKEGELLSGLRLAHVSPTGTLTLNGLTIHQFNQGFPPDPGGALYNRGTLSLSNTAVLNNFAHGGIDEPTVAGAGLYNEGTLSLTNVILADNVGHFSGGGLVNKGGTVRISQSTIARNIALGAGGIYNLQGGTLTLMNTAVIDNGASGTGGLTNGDGWVTITNSTFAGNNNGTCCGHGGALGNNGTLTLVNTTVAENSGVSGGGLFNTGTTVLVNTILAHNTGSSSPDCAGAITSQGNNFIGDPTGCTITGQGPILTGDPGLGDFTDDETPGNGHFPLFFTSQAINAGNNAACPKTDQLGEKRDKLCDIGAIEFQGTAVSSQ
jgi:hypothetical protein